jgi:hypothetical protein
VRRSATGWDLGVVDDRGDRWRLATDPSGRGALSAPTSDQSGAAARLTALTALAESRLTALDAIAAFERADGADAAITALTLHDGALDDGTLDDGVHEGRAPADEAPPVWVVESGGVRHAVDAVTGDVREH